MSNGSTDKAAPSFLEINNMLRFRLSFNVMYFLCRSLTDRKTVNKRIPVNIYYVIFEMVYFIAKFIDILLFNSCFDNIER